MAETALASAYFYFRKGYAHHVQAVCSEHLRKRPEDYVLLFWHACGLMLEGSYAEAQRALERLQENIELEVAVVAALVHCETAINDKEDQSTTLHRRLVIAEKGASEKALLNAAIFYCLLGSLYQLEKAKEWVLRVLKVQPQYSQAICVHGWIELASASRCALGSKIAAADWDKCDYAATLFDAVLSRENFLEAFLGKAWYFEVKEEYVNALNELNKVIVIYPWFLPALAEKGRLALVLQDWDLVRYISNILLQKNPSDIDGLRLTVHVLLCTKNTILVADDCVADLVKCIEKKEPRNPILFLQVVRSISRLAGRVGSTIIQKTILLVEKARNLCPTDFACIHEMAEHLFLLANFKSALVNFRLSSQLNPLNLEGSYKAIQCLLILGDVHKAKEQLEFMVEISASVGRSSSLTYLLAQLYWLQGKDYTHCQELLDESVQLLKQDFSTKIDYSYYADLDPDRLLGISYLYLELSRLDSKEFSLDHKTHALMQGATLLNFLTSLAPNIISGHLLLSQIMYELGESKSALQGLQLTLFLDSSCASAHLLSAKIYIHEGNCDMAKQSLDIAISNNFLVRESVQFHIIQAKIFLHLENYEAAQKILESAMCLLDMEHITNRAKLSYYTNFGSKMFIETTDTERVQIYLLSAYLHFIFDQVIESVKILQMAKKAFYGSFEEGKVVLANCGLAIATSGLKDALQMLWQVPYESIYYVHAKIDMAEIYLNYQDDKSLFISCYEELVNIFQNAKIFILFGEALTRIDESERAIIAFDAAMKGSPQNTIVASKVGQALVFHHEYSRATLVYESSMGNISDSLPKYEMIYDFADLHHKLKNNRIAEHLLINILRKIGEKNNIIKQLNIIDYNMFCLKVSLLLSKVQKNQGKYTNAAKVMSNAKTFQNILFQKLQRQNKEARDEQKLLLADIYFQVAQECKQQNDFKTTIELLHETLKCNPCHTTASLDLAKLHLAMCEISECEKRCSLLLISNPFNVEAGDIIVQLMLCKGHHDSAIIHFEQILSKDPNHYPSLAQLVQLYRRTGQLDKVESYILRAQNGLKTSYCRAGLSFCKGLYARYKNNPYTALQMLNVARTDKEWGKISMYIMIELYLDIDEHFRCLETNSNDNSVINAERLDAIFKLLAQIRHIEPCANRQIALGCYAAMASGRRVNVESAVDQLQELAKKDPEDVHILLALANGLFFLRQTVKAKNHLKFIEKLTFKWEEGDEFERAWLMLANIYLQGRKYDLAEELCKRCIKHNKLCAKAWEGLGLIKERTHTYTDAAECYKNAWKCHGEFTLFVGYHLSYSYLKDKQIIQAISMYHKVNKANPNYQKNKKEILDKARMCVRT